MSAILPWLYLGYYDDSYDDPSMGAFFALSVVPWLVGTCAVFVGAGKTKQARLAYVSVASLWNALGLHSVGRGHRGQRRTSRWR